MEVASNFALAFFIKVFQLLSIITLTFSLVSTTAPTSSQWSNSDHSSLQAIKSLIVLDRMGALSSWNDSLHHCDWKGITCSRRHPGRVTILDLRSQMLQGTLSPYIGNLTFLFRIRLQNNSFNGVIPKEIGGLRRLQALGLSRNSFVGNVPVNFSRCSNLRYLFLNNNQFSGNPQEIGGFRRLQLLNLSNNSFVGEFLLNLTHCTDLKYLALDNNHFSGNIPSVVSSFSKIDRLFLDTNYFSGSIPSSLGNLSSLTIFSIRENHIGGSVPNDLCHIRSLSYIDVADNNLTGEIPSCLYNHSNMNIFSVYSNQLEGSLPSDIFFTLPKIYQFFFYDNKFSGPIPTSLPNATNLEFFEINLNNFTGSVPTNLGRLQHLISLVLLGNNLGTRTGDDLKFIDSLTNCTILEKLAFGDNFLKGRLPVSISNLSTKLTGLHGGGNILSGEIPAGLGNLVKLEIIYLYSNVLSGPIPASLGNLSKLSQLALEDNNLDGSIPPTLGNCTNLLFLNLSYNNLVGTIPPQLYGTNVQIISLDFKNNGLTGSLLSQVSNLTNLMQLFLSNNKLSGHLPESLSNCLSLEELFLENNIFQGEIPKSLKTLMGLNKLDLSQNDLSGEIPHYLGQLPLQYLNLSFNHLEGEVPNIGVFANTSTFFIDGNTKLCGGIWELKLPSCIQKGKKSSLFIKVILPVIVGSLCFLAFSCMLLLRYKRTLKRNSLSRVIFTPWYKRVSYRELLKATNGFSDENLIGVGLHGSVYKGILEHINNTVAVKVIKLQIEGASKSFVKECNALRNLRHRNLLKIITACSTVDFKGNDFKALVFDFMPNGSLESWLHPRAYEQQTTSRVLNFFHRLSIAIDVASALEYLHHQCQPYFVHCDIKPSNVLLDNEMTAHVADFGIAKMFATSSHDSSQSFASSVVIKGSIGYVAPEYGVGTEVSIRGDVYSYGILLLEMFTRKKPTDDMFVNGLSLHNYCKMALPNQVNDIIDPMILLEETDVLDTVEQSKTRGRLQGSLVSIIRMAITCSDQVPVNRMTMSEVLIELQHIKEHYQGVRVNQA